MADEFGETTIEKGDDISLNERVLVEADLAGRPGRFSAVIVKAGLSELWLGLAYPDRRVGYLKERQAVRLTIARPGAALVGVSKYSRALGESRSRIFAVERPEEFERIQRRAHVRYEIGLPVQFHHLDPHTLAPKGRGAAGTTVNVSPGGLLLRTSAPVEVGEELDLTMPLSGGDRISTTDRVIRVDRLDAGGPGEPLQNEVAVKFTRITAIDRDWIVRFVLAADHRRREAAMGQAYAPRSSAFRME